MKTSEKIGEIAKAMATVRKNIEQPAKTAENPFLKNNYVPLEGVVSAIDKALPDELSYVQEATSTDRGVAVTTFVMHSSGEYMQFEPLEVPVSKRDAQAFGSAETYARRYTLSAVFGITSDADDDGQQAANYPQQQNNNRGRQNNQRSSQGRQNQRQNNQRPSQQQQGPVNTNPGKLQTMAVLIQSIAKIKNSTVEALTPVYKKAAHVNDLEHLTEEQADGVIKMLTDQANKVKAEAAKQSNVDTDDLNKQLGEMSDANVRGTEQPTGAK